jgi:hypothetical protein
LLDYLVSSAADGRVPHPLFDPKSYLASDADDLEHQNPLLDYVVKGHRARRPPHPLFDPTYYESHVDVPATWRRTLLEHYCEHPEAAQILPHPAMDTAYLLECHPVIGGGPVNLLRYYLENGGKQGLDPSPFFDAISYRLHHTELVETGEDPLVHYMRTGGQPWWIPGSPNAKRAPGSLGDIVAPDAMFRRIEPLTTSNLPGLRRYLAEASVLERRDHAWRGASATGMLAILAVRANEDTMSHASELVQSLAHEGFNVLVIAEIDGAPAATLFSDFPWVIYRPVGGGPMASWTLGLSLLESDGSAYDRVLLVDDRLVGPLGDTASFWETIKSDNGPDWWQPYELPKSARHHVVPIMVFGSAVLLSEAFRSHKAGFVYTSASAPDVRLPQPDLTEVLLHAGFAPETLLSLTELRERWIRDVADRIDWFSTLPNRLQEVGLAELVSSDIAPSVVEYAEGWYRRMVSSVLTQDDFDPGLLFAETIAEDERFPFLRRDLLLRNPMKTPDILRLPSVLPPKTWTKLKRLLHPELPDVTAESPSLMRLTRAYFNA